MNKWLVGVDLGGTSVKIGFLTVEGEIVHKWEIPTNRNHKGKNIVKEIADSIKYEIEKLGKNLSELKGVGIGAPGPADFENGLILEAVNLGWKEPYSLQKELEVRLNIPCRIENDANCAALGEMWQGAGAGDLDIVFVTLGTGVGGGVVSNGQIVHGIKGAAGEIGHSKVQIEHGYACNCGRSGCLETVASATGVIRLAKDMALNWTEESMLKNEINHKKEISAKDVFDFAKSGDQFAQTVIDRMCAYLGLALSHLGNALNPTKIIIGGGVSKAGDELIRRTNHYFQAYSFPTVAESTQIILATLGNDAGVYGAASLIRSLEK
jgi:glucokinase